jgi:hypothetical protein
MAHHVRKQIRDAAVTALTGLATTGANVFASRVYQLQDAELPALKIDTKDERTDWHAMGGAAASLDRRVTLLVEACVKENTTYNDTIDQICAEVEAVLAGNTLGGLVKLVGPPQLRVELDGAGEQPRAIGSMEFEVMYLTAYNAPTAAL